MPHINRIRVNNVKYNFGTQFYDDFLMRFSCKNTIYDLANGGGKSVLMLLLLQNLIPNCTLDDKQPIEKLFRTSEGSTTIHSMIEWSLSDAHIKDNFKYMLTGFCARKAREQGENAEGEQTADEVGTEKSGTAIEYFNYCIFYRSFNDNDIKNLPLANNGERITYTGLKNYLKDLQKNDYNLEVKIFDRKGDYQRFIADYGLYESEWEIIRGINKTEGHVRTYFESNYKTTRKVVEDLLIEEIIEKSFRNRYSDNDNDGNLAETLLNIKDKLLELSKKKEEINNFDRQIEIIDGFSVRINSIKQLYSGIEEAFARLKKVANSIEHEEDEVSRGLEQSVNQRKDVIRLKNELEGKVETAKVLVDMKELKRLESKLISENDRLIQVDEEIQTFVDRLNILEGGNSYIEYIQCKREYEKLKLVMENILKDNDTLLSNLKELVAVKKIADENRVHTLSEEIERETAVAVKEGQNLKILSEENKKMDNRLAVLNYQAEQGKDKLVQINRKINERKNSTSLLLPSETASLIKEKEAYICELTEKLTGISESSDTYSDKLMNLRLRLQDRNYKLEELENAKKTIEADNGRQLNSSEKLSKIREVYREEDLSKLKAKIESAYRGMVSALNSAADEIKEKESEIKNLELGNPMVTVKQVDKLLDYIRRYHSNDAVSGVEYLAGLNDEKRVAVLKANPVIPYGIIVRENFEQTKMDSRLVENISAGCTFPLINGEKLLKGTQALIDDNSMAFVTIHADEFTSAKVNERITKLKNEVETLNKSYIRKAESEQVVRDDYLFICYILSDGINRESLNPEKELAEINDKILRMLEEIAGIKNEIVETQNSDASAKSQISALDVERNEAVEEVRLLREIEILLREYGEAESRQNMVIAEISDLEKNLADAQKRYDASYNMTRQRNIRIKSMQDERAEISRLWDEQYETYFDEAVYNELIHDSDRQKSILKSDLDTELMAVLESLKKDNSEVSDKEKLLSNYQTSMQRSLQHIDYLGVDINVLENLRVNNELVVSGRQEMADIKQQLTEARAVKKSLRKESEEMRSTKDKLQGRIAHSISIINEKYGEFDENSIKSEEIDTFLNENGRILNSLEERYEELSSEIKKYEEKNMNLSLLKRDVSRLMTKSAIKADVKAGMCDNGINLQNECAAVGEQLDSFIDDKYKRAEEFERDLSLLIDTLKKLNACELASEIRMNVSMPSGLSETEELINMFKETNEYIALEKERVLKGLTDMQIIKDNFENQCVQSCLNIKTELDRLSKLSRITMDDETISIINLKIPYVKEDTFKDRMSEYIDRVAKGTDGFDKTEDKLKFIRNNLCWKKMFSVIVTDMNAIRLNLYKRERIADQSRYLPYEEAVGSTGQSQGIYIQFLIAIINYISSINSRNADASRLKKVIFIDNPFGAAKDVYIWKPIFKLLKTNNVQLIVPARGATPAITGRFDVNYVLGQKMCGGKQQTVVTNYFSNVNNEELDYTTLSFEQTALF